MNQKLPQDVSEMQDIIDIDGIVQTHLPDILQGALLVLGAVLAIVLLVWILRRVSRRRQSLQKNMAPDLRALQDLHRLKKRALIKNEEWPELYFSLDHILRTYITDGFDVDLIDKTHAELKDVVPDVEKVSSQHVQAIVSFWDRAELIKFAKQTVGGDVAVKDFELVEELVRSTKGSLEISPKISRG
jgi:hypothetical protein